MIYLVLVSILFTYLCFNKINKVTFFKLSTEFYLFYFVFFIAIIGSSVFYFTDLNYSDRFIDEKYVEQNLYLVCYVSCAFSFSYMVFHRYIYCNDFKHYQALRITPQFTNDYKIKYALLLLVSIFSCVYVISRLGSIPLLEVFQNDLDKSERFSSKFGFTGSHLIRNIFFIKLSSFLTLSLYAYKINNLGGKLIINLFFYTSLLVTFIGVTLYGSKAPIVIFIMAMYFVYSYSKNVSKYLPIIFFSIIFLITFGLFFIINKNTELTLYSGILSRIFVVPILGHALSLQLFPEYFDFINGANIGFFADFYGSNIRSSYLIMSYINPEGVENQTSGVVSSLFSAEAYAHFGYPGLLISPILVAFIFSTIQTLIIKISIFRYKTPENIALLSYITFYMPFMGGFNDFIWNISLIFILFIASAIRIFKYE